jgi:hypothetical protein
MEYGQVINQSGIIRQVSKVKSRLTQRTKKQKDDYIQDPIQTSHNLKTAS